MSDERIENKDEFGRTKLDRICVILAPVFFITLSVFLIIVILMKYPLTDNERVMGTGGYPFILCITLLFLSIWNLGEVVLKKGKGFLLPYNINGRAVKKGLALLLLFCGSIALMNLIGFIGSMVIFSFFEMTLFEKPKIVLWKRIIYALLFPIVIYVIFKQLSIFLPMPFWWPF